MGRSARNEKSERKMERGFVRGAFPRHAYLKFFSRAIFRAAPYLTERLEAF